MQRISSGKRIELTARDVELFKLLYRYQYLRSDFLHALLGGESQTRFKERLGDLYHDGRFINRPEQQWQFANCRCMPIVYELDVRGEQVLRDQGLLVHNSPLLKKGRMGACRQFAHQLMICDCLASIELGVRQQSSLRFISWQEILAKAPQRTCSTDNPFAIPVGISHTLPGRGTTHRAEVISVASVSSARELFSRLDTGHLCNTSSSAGFISTAASFTSPRSHCSKSFGSRITGIQS
jgi:hypothetical protein